MIGGGFGVAQFKLDSQMHFHFARTEGVRSIVDAKLERGGAPGERFDAFRLPSWKGGVPF